MGQPGYEGHLMAINDEKDSVEGSRSIGGERRSGARHINIFKACAIECHGRIMPGMLRNISDFGAMIEIAPSFAVEPGTVLTYYWDSGEKIIGQVVWRRDNRIGVRNAAESNFSSTPMPARVVRIPCDLPCELHVGGRKQNARVINISQGGLLINGVPALKPGTPVTVVVAGREFCNATTRWSREGVAGVRLAQPVRMAEMAELIARGTPEMGQPGIVTTRLSAVA